MRNRAVTTLTALVAGLAMGIPASSAAASPASPAAPAASSTSAPTASIATASTATARTATANTTSAPALPAGFTVPGGGTVTGPTPVPAPSADLPAGEVCAFPVHLAFPVNQQRGWTYTDASGRTVAEYVTGKLTGVITRSDTGRSVTRDLSGTGLFTYAADGSSALTGYGAAVVGFHTGDSPTNQLLVFAAQGVSRVTFAADGHRTLVFGTGEDLCRTLA